MQTGELLQFFVAVAVAAAAGVAGWVIVRAVRRWTQRDVPSAPFTFQDLRDMRAHGEITEQEFAAMRGVLLAQMQDELTSPPGDEPAHK